MSVNCSAMGCPKQREECNPLFWSHPLCCILINTNMGFPGSNHLLYFTKGCVPNISSTVCTVSSVHPSGM